MNDTQGNSAMDEVPESLSFDSYSLVDFFHGFPRVQLNSYHFKPDCEKYQKSVVFLMVLLPFGLFLASLLKTCILHRFVWRRKKTVKEHGNSLGCVLLISITVLVILATFSLAVGLYGNDLSYDGAAPLLATPSKLDSRNDEANAIVEIERQGSDEDNEAMLSFADVVRNEATFIDGREELEYLVAELRQNYENGQRSLGKLVAKANREAEEEESLDKGGATPLTFLSSLRCWLTSAFFLCTALVLLLLLLGLARRSKVCLGFFIFLGVVIALLDWTLVAFHVGVAVGVSDLCANPEEFLSSYNGDYSSRLIQKIVNCNHSAFEEDQVLEMRLIKTTVRSFLEAEKKMEAIQDQIIGSTVSTSELQESSSSLYAELDLEAKTMDLLHASSLFNCRANQRLLVQALEHVCTTGIAGVGTVLIASILLGFFFTLLILLAGYACKTFRSNIVVCKDDAFNTAVSNGSDNHKSGGGDSGDDDQQPLVTGATNADAGLSIQEQAVYLESESAA